MERGGTKAGKIYHGGSITGGPTLVKSIWHPGSTALSTCG